MKFIDIKMFRSAEDIYKETEEKRKIAQLPVNRRLKYISWFFGIAVIAILITLIIGIDSFSLTALLILRGCAGLCAILFLISVACYLYRINYTYYKQKSKIKKN